MLIKIMPRKNPSYGQLISYIGKEKPEERKEKQKGFVITHNLKGKTQEEWVREFKENEKDRKVKRKDSVKLTHEVISWHKADADKLNETRIRAFIREYVRLRNLNGMYVAVPHFDKDHVHVHLCASGTEKHSGKAMRLSKADLSALRSRMDLFQELKYPDIQHSKTHERRSDGIKISDREYQYKLRTGRESDKERLEKIIHKCFRGASSKDEFLRRLKSEGIEVYMRRGVMTGVILGKRKYRFSRLNLPKERILELDIRARRTTELAKTHHTKEKTKSIGIQKPYQR